MTLLASSLLATMAVAAGAGCGTADDSTATGLVIKDSPEALLGDATSIGRVEIRRNRVLGWPADSGGETTCGYLHEAIVLDQLRGSGHETFLATEPLTPGEHYLVAILDLDGKLPPTTASSIDERDRAFLECRKQLPHYVLGWARFEDPASDRILVGSSAIVPDVVREAAVNGSVHLDAIREFLRPTSSR